MKLSPERRAQTTSPLWNTRALVVALCVVAVLTLTWLGLTVFRRDSPSTPVVSEGPGRAQSQPSAPAREAIPRVVNDEPTSKLAASTSEPQAARATPIEPTSIPAASVASKKKAQPESPALPVNEVIPSVPQSALQTIRGTIRVLVRVIIDKQGTVLTATSEIPGPSRYFERLSLEAAKKWTFTPAVTQEERTMLLRFQFTREGAAAQANPPQ